MDNQKNPIEALRKDKPKGGRPTKYKPRATPKKVYTLVDYMTVETFLECCSIEHIAYALDIHKDTLYEWKKKYPEFSDAIKKFETKRNMLFYRFLASKQIPPAKWIFLAKNWMKMRDRLDHKMEGSVILEISKEFLPDLDRNKTSDDNTDTPEEQA